MTENKRFTLTDNGLIEDHQEQILLDGGEDCWDLLELVNELNEENEKLKRIMRKSVVERLLDGFEKSYKDLEEENEELKQNIRCHKERISILSQLLDFADAIIDLSDDERAKEKWENMNTKLNQKWEKMTDNMEDVG